MLPVKPKYLKECLFRCFAHALPLPPPDRFAVFSRGRSGSTLLMSLLESHPFVSTRGEVIGEWILRQPCPKWELKSIGPVRYIERRFGRTGFEKKVGIKFLYYQLENSYAKRWGVTGLTKLDAFLRCSNDIKIIHVKRRHYLKTLTSIHVASKTKQYHIKNKSTNNVQIYLSEDECLEEFNRVRDWERYYDALFCNRSLEIYYEDLIENRIVECNRILDFLDLSRRELTTPMKKQRNRPLSNIIVNFNDLKIKFAGTEWAWFFNE